MELNVVYNEDCLEGMKQIPNKSVDLVITDPPYLIDTVGSGLYSQKDKQYIKELNFMKDGFSKEILDEICRVMKKINLYIFCSQKQIIPLLDYFVREKKCNWNIITWHKTNPIPACGNKYLTDTEYVLFFREKGVKIYGDYQTKFTYYLTSLNQKDKKKYNHPTIKPLNILQNFIINSSKEGEIILDPFMGSGTTAIACMNTNRNYIGFELDKGYYDIILERIKNHKPDVKPDVIQESKQGLETWF